jgi:hypothetical protein
MSGTDPRRAFNGGLGGLPRDHLAQSLADAHRSFYRGRNTEESDGGRNSAGRALLAVIEYLRSARPDVRDDLLPLIRLATALGDLETGRVDPMLAKPKIPGAPPTATGHDVLKQIVAVAVSILQDEVVARDAAVRYVKARLEKYGIYVPTGTIKKWQSEVRAELPRGVGMPRRPDTVGLAALRAEKCRPYLDDWFRWRGQKTISAKAYVDLLLNEDLAALR